MHILIDILCAIGGMSLFCWLIRAAETVAHHRRFVREGREND